MLNSDLASRLELWGFEQGVSIYKDFSLGMGLEISALDVSCLGDDSINSIKSRIAHFLNGLPSGLSLQLVQSIQGGSHSLIEEHRNLSEKSLTEFQMEIVTERCRKFKELDRTGQLPNQKLYLFLRKNFEKKPKASSSGFAFWRKRRIDLRESLVSSEIVGFLQTVDSVQSSLANLEIKSERLGPAETFELLYSQWNPDRGAGPPLDLHQEDVRDQACLTDAVIGMDNFSLGKIYHKVLSLKMLPESTFAAMSAALHLLPFESRLHFSMEVLDQQKEISGLQLQRRMAYASTVGKKGASDLDAQAKLRDLEGILAEMIQGSEKVFKVALHIVLRSGDLIELENQVNETLMRVREMNGAEAMVETYACFDLFTQIAIPQARVKERTIKVHTSVLADLLPIYGNWKGHENPRMLLRSREGGLLPFDVFSDKHSNFNMIVSGSSGAGKSYFVNSLISQMLKEAPKVYILDVGASYKRVCENLNGQYIELGIKSDLAINPFAMTDAEKLNSECRDQKTKFLVALVELMTKESGRTALGKLERAELERLIQETMQEESAPQLSHLRLRLVRHPEVEISRLGRILSLWCGDSPFGKFVDRPTTVKLDRDVVCFDLKGLDSHPDLQSVCLFIMTDLISREVQRDRTRMKFAILDECWRLLQDEAATVFIGDIFRTFRKYRASAIAISQTMDDFTKSRIAGAIMPNSSMKWILKQRGADQESLCKALSLNDREMDLIASLDSKKGHFSEAFLMAEDQREVVRIDSTPLEYWLFTTDSSDLALINHIASAHPDLSGLDMIKQAARDYPFGASGPKAAA